MLKSNKKSVSDMTSYYNYLEDKHRSMDLKITNFYNSFDENELKKMKIQRLRLKDEMNYYKNLIEEES